ncbi:MAG: DUF4105 domain-containing protein [Saprospiraceae bacterium]
MNSITLPLSRIILLFLFILVSFNTLHAKEVLTDDTKVSLLTCDPGGEIYSLFGHSAIWIYDKELGINEVYNYGTFDFRDPKFLSKFLQGKLLYWLALDDGERFLYAYNNLKRGIKENVFLLDSIQKNQLYHALKTNAEPENRDYYYDFFFDNCSTRILDLFETNFGPYYIPEVSSKTFRDLIHEYLEGRDWTKFGIDLIIGSLADKVTSARQQMFLPEYVPRHMSKAKDADGQSVMNKGTPIINHPWVMVSSFWITPIVLFTILLILELLVITYDPTKKWLRTYDTIWMVIMAICSAVLMFMWTGTNHQSCGLNFNLIVFSPLIIIWLLAKKFDKKFRILNWLSLLIIVPYILLPFVKMGVQNIPSAALLITLITAMKIFRSGNLKSFRKWV